MEGMEKQLTAVEWLVDKLKENGVNFWQEEIEMIEEAKEMEKQQIIDAYNNGDNRSAELYYNETFKSE
jgi:predicted secreted protein